MSDCDEKGIKKWELVVFPALFAFLILAIYFFFLIYRVSGDMHRITESVDTNMTLMSSTMVEISLTMKEMNNKVNILHPMSQDIHAMAGSMSKMQQDIQMMNRSTYNMQRDIGNIGGPMSMFSSFMPW